jgi:hypothetical protein
MDVLEEFFPSKHLKATDLNGKEVTVTIHRVEREKIGDEGKPVLYFNGKDKGVVLNKGNTSVLVDAFGRNSKGWIGQQVILFSIWTEYQNKPVQGLRIRALMPPPTGPAPVQRRPDPITSGPIVSGLAPPMKADMDDDIPFAPEFR